MKQKRTTKFWKSQQIGIVTEQYQKLQLDEYLQEAEFSERVDVLSRIRKGNWLQQC